MPFWIRCDRVGERLVVEQVVLHGLEIEPRAQRRHALVLHQDRLAFLVGDELEHGAAGDLLRTRVALVTAHLGELLAQRFVLRMWRLVGVERRGGVLAVRELREHVERIGRDLVVGDVAADARIVHTAKLCLACIVERGFGEPDLGFGERRGTCVRRDRRHRIVGRVHAVRVCVAQVIDRLPGAIGRAVHADPERLVIARGIKRLDRSAVALAVDDPAELAAVADELAQRVADRLIGMRDDDGCWSRRRRRCRSRRRDGRGRGFWSRRSRRYRDVLEGWRRQIGRVGQHDRGRAGRAGGFSRSADISRARRRHVGRLGHRDERFDRFLVLCERRIGRCGDAKDQREGGPGQNAIKAPAWHVKSLNPPWANAKPRTPNACGRGSRIIPHPRDDLTLKF